MVAEGLDIFRLKTPASLLYTIFSTLAREALIEMVSENKRRKTYALTPRGRQVLQLQIQRLEIMAAESKRSCQSDERGYHERKSNSAEREVFYRAMQKFTLRSLPLMMSGMRKILDKMPRTLPQPLLIVTGEHDQPIILSNAQDWQQREPNARLAVIPAAGHCANMDNPEVFNQVLKEFLDSHVNR